MRSEMYRSVSPLAARHLLAAGLAMLLLPACDGDSNGTTGGAGQMPPSVLPGPPRCPAPQAVACIDQTIDQLRLFPAVNPAMVTTESKGGGVFESRIDARAGTVNPTMSFVYVRFGADTLEKVAIGDEQAFESMDWDVAFRRYIIRDNSGASGPSCVEAAESGAPFTSLATVPAALGFEKDIFLEPPACMATGPLNELGGPLTAISTFYNYINCLTMTGEVFVIKLRDGRHVAMEVLAYYPKNVQDACNSTGSLPMGSSGGGQFHIRWKLIPG